jgi:hypothetical protein
LAGAPQYFHDTCIDTLRYTIEGYPEACDVLKVLHEFENPGRDPDESLRFTTVRAVEFVLKRERPPPREEQRPFEKRERQAFWILISISTPAGSSMRCRLSMVFEFGFTMSMRRL